ncbi:hypothetical protein HW561_21335 [Rhodobacteraceae bacterium B1Z28]|uniref:Uncharacterized protein n=1 Tax=Ruegeria haliotis TaxID=2747601 RepID=A0ABX2PVW2_9RHOB|nr:hypothetical protein [Ruegeria haliotis]NVO58333.1 hypothetical protein [Ruegeria haliotis]
MDQNAIARWVSAHPSVATWLRERVDLPILTGWFPYGRWSATPAGVNDEMIVGSGIGVRLGADELIHDLNQALIAVRAKVSTSRKAIRIAGLSGVGKTRFVQALFEDDVGENSLPATQAIYCDAGQATDPPPLQMLEVLLQRGESAFVVVDNCPPDLHGDLAKKLAASTAAVKLITIEYDLRDDRLNETEVIRMEAEGEEIVGKLIHRRYPKMRRGDAQRIASMSDGNARLALALAGAVQETSSLSTLADVELFDRLF